MERYGGNVFAKTVIMGYRRNGCDSSLCLFLYLL